MAGTPGVNGSLTVGAAGTVVNLYDVAVSASGRTIVTTNIANLQNAALGNVVPGSVLLVYQANGATIDGTDNTSAWGNVTSYGNAGYYDFVTVGSVSGNTITIAASCNALSHTYTTSSTTSTQIVRVPQYSSLTINAGASIAATPWNGSDGGIVAIDVNGATTINGSINVTGDGFAGAAAYANAGNSAPPGHPEVTDYFESGETGANLATALAAAKGESIAGNDATYDSLDGSRYGRGAPANGGGGGDGHNSGGGGGANGNNGNTWYGQGVLDPTYTAYYSDSNGKNPTGAADPGYANMTTDSGGGRGGYSFGFNQAGNTAGIVPYPVGGLGGRPMTVESTTRVFFGGGGGAGDANNVAGGYGGNGGGIVILNTGTLAGSGSIVANGAAGGTSAQQDAGGGGGGGGSVVVETASGSGSLATINANGGAGGANDQTASTPYEAEGPGGGGGGGYVAAVGDAGTITTTGGAEGLSQGETAVTQNFTAYGATEGATGASGAATALTYCYTPVVGAAKAASVTNNGNGTYTVTYAVVLQNYGDTPLTALTATDPLGTTFPSGTTFSISTAPSVTSASTGASATVNASFNGSSNQTVVSAGTLPVGGTLTVSFGVLIRPPVGSQTYSNSLTASANGTTGNANGYATTDLSNSGTNPDPAGLGQPNQTSENVATPITVTGQPSLQKTVRNVTTGEATGLTSDTAVPGNQLEYTLSFTNGTGGALSAFSVTDTVPTNTTYKSAACGALAAGVTACTATLSGGVVTWRLTGTLNNGATQTFLLDVTVN